VSNTVPSLALKKQLREHLANYVAAAIAALEDQREWPRPFSAPLRLSELHLPRDFYSLDKELRTFLHESGLRERLATTGHTWLWHREPFPDLFLEMYAAAVIGYPDHDRRAFSSLFARAWSELCRGTVTLRQVVSVSGVPFPRDRTRLAPGVRWMPYKLNTAGPGLWKLLLVDRQRDYPLIRPQGAGALIAHDVTFRKRRDDDAFALGVLDDLERRTRELALTLRLYFGDSVFVETLHTAQLSTFPLYPFMETRGRDSAVHSVSMRYLKPAELQNLRSTLALVDTSALRANGLETLVRRFQDSFRWQDNVQNVVDLAVCLESLFDIKAPELSYKLSTRVASLLGRTDDERLQISRRVLCVYNARSVLVHGPRTKKTPEQEITESLKTLYGSTPLHANGFEDRLRPLVQDIRELIRRALTARLARPAAWPSESGWNELALSHRTASKAAWLSGWLRTDVAKELPSHTPHRDDRSSVGRKLRERPWLAGARDVAPG
jgi:hypothetical protein